MLSTKTKRIIIDNLNVSIQSIRAYTAHSTLSNVERHFLLGQKKECEDALHEFIKHTETGETKKATKYTLQELINCGIVWNKEIVQIVVEDNEGNWIRSKVDRIEFLADKYENYTMDYIESDKVFQKEVISNTELTIREISILVIHISKEE